jgi:hypothetical protein
LATLTVPVGLAGAGFGALVCNGTFLHGLRARLLIAAVVALGTAVPGLLLRPPTHASTAQLVEGI